MEGCVWGRWSDLVERRELLILSLTYRECCFVPFPFASKDVICKCDQMAWGGWRTGAWASRVPITHFYCCQNLDDGRKMQLGTNSATAKKLVHKHGAALLFVGAQGGLKEWTASSPAGALRQRAHLGAALHALNRRAWMHGFVIAVVLYKAGCRLCQAGN